MWPFLKSKDLGRGKRSMRFAFPHPAGGNPGENPPGVNLSPGLKLIRSSTRSGVDPRFETLVQKVVGSEHK